nr:sulfatase-like hydrolase/transferase [Bacteroidota bacterium]
MQKPASGPRRLHIFLRLVLFWFFTFTIYRIVFIAGYCFHGHAISIPDALFSLISGIRLDFSTIAYVILPSYVLWSLYQFLPNRKLSVIHRWSIGPLLFGVAFLNVSGIRLYHDWQSLVSYKVFDYLKYPKEVMAFVSLTDLVLLGSLCAVLTVGTIFIFKRWIGEFSLHRPSWTRYLLMIIFPFIIITAARGGLQQIPVNESSAYFSDTPFYNHTSINSFWYFIHSFLETEHTDNPYIFMKEDAATARLNNLYNVAPNPDTTIVKSKHPNIVIILLESWTADIIQSLGDEENITPQFDALAKDGLLFTQIYSAGARTEHGLISVLSGYPPPPHQSIITVPYKVEKLKNINDVFLDHGYTSSFYYGGEIGFANMKSYLLNAHFKTIVDKYGFDEDQLSTKWGAHDEFVFQRQLDDLRSVSQPFLSVLLTLSSHEPFEVPMETKFPGKNESDKFRNAAYYTDRCLGEYFRKAKLEPWFDNTLFILVADHGHRLPKKTNLNLPQAKRIPLLFYGNVLRDDLK